ncbi:hypothetical protein DDB_G0284475 [Dictyostelium discoideum AX4]|uniref:Uncharacterized protein n=1 Tax=Dictyostelium discoideum TaxID=44689 RepID=Q54PL8_DICDI|nr:hypothetical protein DDB_G0284475 [Dictyostelium discoideum AX4]EAL65164.1 hypothetical protein DDB_G0284475 [Dictyostelium discoideum AX4]|eukprot:XP_638514.1 hypothetical protein DDB_G0284475 [Dictyostelium discoideum AX4]
MDLFDFDPYSPNNKGNNNNNNNNNNSTNQTNLTTTTTTTTTSNAGQTNNITEANAFFNGFLSPQQTQPQQTQQTQQTQLQPQQTQTQHFNHFNPFDDIESLLSPSSNSQQQRQQQQQQQQQQYPQQQQQQQYQQQEKEKQQILNEIHNIEENRFYVEKFEGLLMELLDSTVIQSAIQSEKLKNEVEIRDLYKNLWRFNDVPVEVQDYCPCGSLLKHTISNQYYTINENVAKQLASIFTQNHSYNTTEVIASFFTQTLNQHRLNYYIYKFIDIDNLKQSLSFNNSQQSQSQSQSQQQYVKPNLESLQNIIIILESVIKIFKQLTLPDNLQTIVNQLSMYLFKYAELIENGEIIEGGGRAPVQRVRGMTLFNDLLSVESIDIGSNDHHHHSEDSVINKEIENFTKSLKDNLDPDFLEWGYTLIHPSLFDIFKKDWLIKLFNPNNNRILTETQYVNLLLQIDFTKLNTINSNDFGNLNIIDKLYTPLQNGLTLSISKNMIRLSILISKILCILTYYFKIDNTINILFKSIWPSQFIGCLVLPLVNWEDMEMNTMSSMFCDVYQLTISPQNYYGRNFNDKLPIRNQFFQTMFRYQYLVEQSYHKDLTIAEINNSCKFPQLTLLGRIANQFSNQYNLNQQQQQQQQQQQDEESLQLDGGLKFNLSRLIFDELFYFAFVSRSQNYLNGSVDSATSNVIQNLYPIFKSEIFNQLFILLQSQPHLVNRFMFNVSQNLLYLDIESFTSFIRPSNSSSSSSSSNSSGIDPLSSGNYNNPLYFWDMSGDGIHWLALILSHKMIPTLMDNEFIQPDCLMNLVIEPLLFTSQANEMEQYRINYQNVSIASDVVFKVLSTTNWNKVSSISKLKIILFLLGSRKHLSVLKEPPQPQQQQPIQAFSNPIRNIIKFLLRSKILLSNETNVQMIKQMIHIDFNSLDFKNDNGLFLFIQILLSLQLANYYIEMVDSNIQEAYNILTQTMPKINQICNNNNNPYGFEFTSSILCSVIYIFRSTPFIVQSEVDEIFKMVTLSKNDFSIGFNVLLDTLKIWFIQSSPQFFTDHSLIKNITSWVYLMKSNINSEENMAILNNLFASSFFKSLKLSLNSSTMNSSNQQQQQQQSNNNNNNNDLVNEIIDSLLQDTPNIVPNSKVLLKLVERRPWLVYFLARAYTRGKQNVSSSTRKESLVLLKDLAMSLKTEPISMIFWEHFWVIYYDGIIGSKGVETLSTDFKNHLISSAVHPYTKSSYKGPINPIIKRIFESFELWNLQSTLPFNKRLIHPQNVQLYNLLLSNNLPYELSDHIDLKKYDINQKQWLKNQNLNLSPDQIILQYLNIKKEQQPSQQQQQQSQQQPQQKQQINNFNDNNEEYKKYLNFKNTCNNIKKELDNNGHDLQTVDSIKFFRDIRQYLGQSKSLSRSILQDDKEFLSKSEKLYTTEINEITQIIKCSYSRCIGVEMTLKLKKSINNEDVALKISENRKQFSDDYYNFFEKVHQLTILSSMMEDNQFISQFKKYQQKENLFKFLISLMSDYQDSIHKSIFIPFFTEITLKIGKILINENNDNQFFLIDTFLPMLPSQASNNLKKSSSKTITNSGGGGQSQKDKVENIDSVKDYSIFIQLFQPSKISDIHEYIDIFQRVITTLPTLLSKESDLKKIILSFKLDERIPLILQLNNGKNCLLNLLQLCIQLPVLIDVVELITSQLLRNDMILIFNIFDIILDSFNNNNNNNDHLNNNNNNNNYLKDTKSQLLICNIINGKQSIFYKEILQNQAIKDNENLQQQRTMQLSSMIDYLTNPKSAIPSITTIFLLNNILSYEFITSQSLDGHLNNTRDAIINSIKSTIVQQGGSNNNKNLLISIQDFKLSINLLTNLIKLVPKSINLLWDVFYNSYVPLLESFTNNNSPIMSPSISNSPTSISSDNYEKQLQKQQEQHQHYLMDQEIENQYLDAITNFFGMLAIDGHLSSAVFHIISSDTLEQMNYILSETIFGNVVVILFSILDWSLLFKQSKISNKTALNYLKLCMYISIVNGTNITSPEFKLSLATDGNLDWFKCGDLSEASLIFDGSSFVKLLTRSSLVQSSQQQSPNQLIMSCLTLFKDITLLLDNYSLATALALEIRSLIYLVIQTPTNYWHLEYTEQESLLKTILLPLIRSLADNQILKNSPTEISGAQQRMKSILKVTLSCLDDISYPMRSLIKFAIFPISGLSNDNHANKELYGKISALILQFCSSCSINLCLQIMSCAHLTLNQSLSNYCKVIDNILRSFYSIDTNKSMGIGGGEGDENSNSTGTNNTNLINKYLIFPNNHENPSRLLKTCIQENCHLLMYIIAIQSQRNDTLNLSEFIQDVINITFRNNHEYELWLSWMLVIKLIENQSQSSFKNKHLIQSISDFKDSISSYFGTAGNKITSLFSNKQKTIMVQTHLAARACLLYLQRILVQRKEKDGEKTIKDVQLLNQITDSLVDLKKKSTNNIYSPYQDFFNESENFLSPLVEFEFFSNSVIRTLVPFANYILNILSYE